VVGRISVREQHGALSGQWLLASQLVAAVVTVVSKAREPAMAAIRCIVGGRCRCR